MKNPNHFNPQIITKKMVFNVVISLLLIYFVFHTIYGDRGLIAYFKVNQKLDKSYEELKILRSERIEQEHKVRLLKDGDKDMIDEKARNILGVAGPDEQVFTNEQTNN